MQLNQFTIIQLEWNCYNGFVFNLFHIDSYRKPCTDKSLLGIAFSRSYFIISLLYFEITIFDKTSKL